MTAMPYSRAVAMTPPPYTTPKPEPHAGPLDQAHDGTVLLTERMSGRLIPPLATFCFPLGGDDALHALWGATIDTSHWYTVDLYR
jgi:hypothetical protein